MSLRTLTGATVSLMGNHIEDGYSKDKDAYSARHFVNWSGGTDSTLCLYELLNVYGPSHVVAVSFSYPWLHEKKYKEEKEVREKFKELMNEQQLGNFTHVEFDMSFISENFIDVYPGGNAQASSWLLTIPIYLTSGDYLYDTSILEDDLTLHNHELVCIIDNLEVILNREINLRQPYIYYHKYDILRALMKYHIYEYTWTCEMPPVEDRKMCLHCNPCKTQISSLYYLKSFGPTYIKDQVDNKLSELEEQHSKEKNATVTTEELESEDDKFTQYKNDLKEYKEDVFKYPKIFGKLLTLIKERKQGYFDSSMVKYCFDNADINEESFYILYKPTDVLFYWPNVNNVFKMYCNVYMSMDEVKRISNICYRKILIEKQD